MVREACWASIASPALVVTIAYLLLNAVGWPAPPRLALFALALTVTLFATCVACMSRSLAPFAKTTSKT